MNGYWKTVIFVVAALLTWCGINVAFGAMNAPSTPSVFGGVMFLLAMVGGWILLWKKVLRSKKNASAAPWRRMGVADRGHRSGYIQYWVRDSHRSWTRWHRGGYGRQPAWRPGLYPENRVGLV